MDCFDRAPAWALLLVLLFAQSATLMPKTALAVSGALRDIRARDIVLLYVASGCAEIGAGDCGDALMHRY